MARRKRCLGCGVVLSDGSDVTCLCDDCDESWEAFALSLEYEVDKLKRRTEVVM